MKRGSIFAIATIAALYLLSTGCLSAPSPLPRDMPADFSVQLYNSGGMLPISDNLLLGTAEGIFTKHYYNYTDHMAEARFVVPRQELEALYKVFYENRFDYITTYEEMIYDRGGTQVTITYDKQIYSVVDGGMDLISPEWQQNWYTIISAVTRLKTRLLTPLLVPVSFELSPQAMELTDLSIHIDEKSIYYAKEPDLTSLAQGLVPGDYVIALYHDGGKVHVRASVTVTAPLHFTVDVQDGQLVLR